MQTSVPADYSQSSSSQEGNAEYEAGPSLSRMASCEQYMCQETEAEATKSVSSRPQAISQAQSPGGQCRARGCSTLCGRTVLYLRQASKAHVTASVCVQEQVLPGCPLTCASSWALQPTGDRTGPYFQTDQCTIIMQMAVAEQLSSAGRKHLMSSPAAIIPHIFCSDVWKTGERKRELYCWGFSALAFSNLVEKLNPRFA